MRRLIPVLLMLFSLGLWAGEGKVSLENEWGFVGIIFSTPHGQVLVRAPEALIDGDVFAGSYRLDPAGEKEKKKKKNLEKLLKLKLTVDEVEVALQPKGGYKAEARAPFVNLHLSGKKVDLKATVAVREKPSRGSKIPGQGGSSDEGSGLSAPNTDEAGDSREGSMDCPLFAQGSWPMKLSGPVAGDPLDTVVKLNGEPVDWIAVSPREVVVRTPVKFSGLGNLAVDSGGQSRSCESHGMLIDLGVGTLVLHKGQTTTLSIKVSGLQDLKRPVPLRLVNETPAGITMAGGEVQVFSIRPEEVKAGGIWTTTRTLTGKREGSFGITASLDRDGMECQKEQERCAADLADLENTLGGLEKEVEASELGLDKAREGLEGWQKSLLAQQALYQQARACESSLEDLMGGHFDFTRLEDRTTAYAPKTEVYPERQEQVDGKFQACQDLWQKYDTQQKTTNRELLLGDEDPAVKQAKKALDQARSNLAEGEQALKDQADKCQAQKPCS